MIKWVSDTGLLSFSLTLLTGSFTLISLCMSLCVSDRLQSLFFGQRDARRVNFGEINHTSNEWTNHTHSASQVKQQEEHKSSVFSFFSLKYYILSDQDSSVTRARVTGLAVLCSDTRSILLRSRSLVSGVSVLASASRFRLSIALTKVHRPSPAFTRSRRVLMCFSPLLSLAFLSSSTLVSSFLRSLRSFLLADLILARRRKAKYPFTCLFSQWLVSKWDRLTCIFILASPSDRTSHLISFSFSFSLSLSHSLARLIFFSLSRANASLSLESHPSDKPVILFPCMSAWRVQKKLYTQLTLHWYSLLVIFH